MRPEIRLHVAPTRDRPGNAATSGCPSPRGPVGLHGTTGQAGEAVVVRPGPSERDGPTDPAGRGTADPSGKRVLGRARTTAGSRPPSPPLRPRPARAGRAVASRLPRGHDGAPRP